MKVTGSRGIRTKIIRVTISPTSQDPCTKMRWHVNTSYSKDKGKESPIRLEFDI